MRTGADKNAVGAFTMLLYGIFVLMVLFLIIMGSFVYKTLVDDSRDANTERASLAYVASCVAAGDSANALVFSDAAPEGRALVLREAVDGTFYETRLYLCQGKLVEEYAAASRAYSPGQAQVIAETSHFDFSFDAASNLLTVSTDAGRQIIALSSVQEVSF